MHIDFCGWMRPTIVVPDVHETTHWKGFAEMRRPGDRMIFLGDYFDRRGRGPFAPCLDNFLEICAYARTNPGTRLLMGNHDYNYMPCARWTPDPWDYREGMIRKAIMDNLDILDMVFMDAGGSGSQDGPGSMGAVFSHGGLTNSFLRRNGLSDPSEVNGLWREKPELFDWLELDPETGERSSMEGDDPWQPPTWARTMALTEDGVRGYSQVVGHTPVCEPEILTTQFGDQALMTCTLDDRLIRVGGQGYEK